MTLFEVPKQVGDIDEPWWSIIEINGKKVVYIACPICYGGMALTNYKVLDNGVVIAIGGSNSVKCPGCIDRGLKEQFHQTIQLLNWDPKLLE